MKIVYLAAAAALLASPAFAGEFGGGGGVTLSDSTSTATAATNSTAVSVAKGGAGGAGGSAQSTAEGGSAQSQSTTGPSSSASNQQQKQSADNAGNAQSMSYNEASPLATQRLVTAPPVVAPALTTTLTETCMGSSSGGISVMGFGGTLGSTWTDSECVIRLDARELVSLGDVEAARALMCQKDRVRLAYGLVGKPCPGTPGYVRQPLPASFSAPALQAPAPPPPPALPPAIQRKLPLAGERG